MWFSRSFKMRLAMRALVTTFIFIASGGIAVSNEPQSTKNVYGRVTDETGNVIDGATVWLPAGSDDGKTHRIVRTKSDVNGKFSLAIPAAWLVEGSGARVWQEVWVYARGRRVAVTNVYKALYKNEPCELEIKLGPEKKKSLIIQTPDGNPLAGATVTPYYIPHSGLADLGPPDIVASITATTDADGHTAMPMIARNYEDQALIVSEEFGIQAFRVKREDAETQVVTLRPVGRIEGRLVADDRKYVGRIPVIFCSSRWSDLEGLAETLTDEHGRFVIPKIGIGSLDVVIDVAESCPLRPKIAAINPCSEISPQVEENATVAIEVPLIPTIVVQGEVYLRGTNQPIKDARVAIGYGIRWQRTNSVTGVDGKYVARVLPGEVTIDWVEPPEEYVADEGYGDNVIDVPQDGTVFKLPRVEVAMAKTITGKLVDEAGQSVVATSVQVLAGRHLYGRCKTGQDGIFTITGVPNYLDASKVKYEIDDSSVKTESVNEPVKTDPLIVLVRESWESKFERAAIAAKGKMVAELQIIGNKSVPEERLLELVQINGGQTFLKEPIDAAIESLTSYYRQLGFFQARLNCEVGSVKAANRPEKALSEENDAVAVTLIVEEGPRYKVRRITFAGNKTLTTEVLAKELKFRGGDFFDQEKMTADIKAIKDKYACAGQDSADVRPDVRFLRKSDALDLIYTVREISKEP
jgi:hypothetical protein